MVRGKDNTFAEFVEVRESRPWDCEFGCVLSWNYCWSNCSVSVSSSSAASLFFSSSFSFLSDSISELNCCVGTGLAEIVCGSVDVGEAECAVAERLDFLSNVPCALTVDELMVHIIGHHPLLRRYFHTFRLNAYGHQVRFLSTTLAIVIRARSSLTFLQQPAGSAA